MNNKFVILCLIVLMIPLASAIQWSNPLYFLKLSGGTMSGNINMSGNDISNIGKFTGTIPQLEETREINELYQLTDKKYVDEAVSSLGARYFMTNNDSGIEDYKYCSLYNPDAFNVTYSDLTNGQYIAGWISPNQNEPDVLLAGIYDWNIVMQKTSGTKTLRVYWNLVERLSNGTEIIIATSSISDEISTKKRFTVPLWLSEDYDVSSDGYVIGKIYAVVGDSGSNPSLKFYCGGNDATHWEIPVNLQVLSNIFVPYTGANQNVNLENYNLTADTINISNELQVRKINYNGDGLVVYGPTNFSQNLLSKNYIGLYGSTLISRPYNGDLFWRYTYGAVFDTGTGRHLYFNTNDKTHMIIYSDGNLSYRASTTSGPYNDFVITSDGVSIKKYNPSYSLDVNGSAYIGNPSIGGVVLTVPGWIKIASTGYGLYGDNIALMTIRNNFANGSIDFRTGGDNVRMLIDNSGDVYIDSNTLYVNATTNKVGIGTTNPNQQLHVNGNITVTGILNISGGTSTNLGINFYDVTQKTGIYEGNNELRFVSNGNDLYRIWENGYMFGAVVTGSPAIRSHPSTIYPAYGFYNRPGLGISSNTNPGMDFLINQTIRMTLNDTGLIIQNGSFYIKDTNFSVNKVTQKVGIKTMTPTHELNVIGDANITGSFYNDVKIGGGFGSGGITLKDTGDIWMDGSLYITENITTVNIDNLKTNGSLLPTVDNLFDIGNSSYQWKDGYFANEIYLNNNPISTWLYNQTIPAQDYCDAQISAIDYSTKNVNSSNYWDNLDTPLAEWSSTYNETYATWAYNQTTPAISYADNTFLKLSGGTISGTLATQDLEVSKDSSISNAIYTYNDTISKTCIGSKCSAFKSAFPTEISRFTMVSEEIGLGDEIRSYLFSDDTNGPYFTAIKSRGSVSSPSNVQNGDTLGALYFKGHYSGSFLQASYISAIVEGSPVNYIPSKLKFYTSTSTSIAERMSINSTTVNVVPNLNVQQNITANKITTLSDLIIPSTKYFYLDGGGDTYITEASSNKVYHTAGGTTQMYVTSTGVGIGADPTSKFEVYGVTEMLPNKTSFSLCTDPAPQASTDLFVTGFMEEYSTSGYFYCCQSSVESQVDTAGECDDPGVVVSRDYCHGSYAKNCGCSMVVPKGYYYNVCYAMDSGSPDTVYAYRWGFGQQTS